MKTSLMVFGSKPKKLNSLKPGDKRRISLLNSDFKIVTGIEGKRFGDTELTLFLLASWLLEMIVEFITALILLEMQSSMWENQSLGVKYLISTF